VCFARGTTMTVEGLQKISNATVARMTTRTVIAMHKGNASGALILVVQDVEETRDGIEALLLADGYRVDTARDEKDAVMQTQRRYPDLILVNLGQVAVEVIAAARRIRARAELSEEVPVVIFCVDGVGEGDEVEIGQKVYVTRPDNFNQLRGLLGRLVHRRPLAA
jgi:CheY-like chemotaxis protein